MAVSDTTITERFQRETATHRMTVLHDDGLYRHLRFRAHHLCNDAEYRPTSSFYWFDLITWPGALTINGDCGTFAFSRVTDMFEFFRSKYGINPQYWAEKVRGETRVKSYSEDKFRALVADEVKEAAKDWPGLAEAVEKAFYHESFSWDVECDITHEDGARRALSEFEHGATWTAECVCGGYAEGLSEDDARDWRVRHLGAGHRPETKRVEGFRFTDTWEWDLQDYDWTFLWCCHAIQWGVSQYDSQRVTV
jgi:hypothetical protein